MTGGELSIFFNKKALDCGVELTEVTAHEFPNIDTPIYSGIITILCSAPKIAMAIGNPSQAILV